MVLHGIQAGTGDPRALDKNGTAASVRALAMWYNAFVFAFGFI